MFTSVPRMSFIIHYIQFDGTAMPLMISDLIEAGMDDTGEIKDEEFIAGIAGNVYIGGSETVNPSPKSILHQDI